MGFALHYGSRELHNHGCKKIARLAQWQSITLTRWGSQVQVLYRARKEGIITLLPISPLRFDIKPFSRFGGFLLLTI